MTKLNTITQNFLTTFDNPFDPNSQFEEWFRFDTQNKYYTCALVDRVMETKKEEITDPDDRDPDTLYELAIKSIVAMNPGLYVIVQKDTEVLEVPISKEFIDQNQ